MGTLTAMMLRTVIACTLVAVALSSPTWTAQLTSLAKEPQVKQDTAAPETSAPATTKNCHCDGCHDHYDRTRHIVSNEHLCMLACKRDYKAPNRFAAQGTPENHRKCLFSLYDSEARKCYLYAKVPKNYQGITNKVASSGKKQFTCWAAKTQAPTRSPTHSPTNVPTTLPPSKYPTTRTPTRQPTRAPVVSTTYTISRGGNGGGAVNSYCSGNYYINYWSIRTGALVDRIQGRCNNGSWLSRCGGGGGGARSFGAPHSSRYISVRSGSLIDKFNGYGGNGGGAANLDCGSGRKITGYQTRCGSLVDKIRFQCKNI